MKFNYNKRSITVFNILITGTIFLLLLALLIPMYQKMREKVSMELKNERTVYSDTAVYPDDRFRLSAIEDVRDNLAYGNYRRIYILVDKQTGKEYIGISGIGVTELLEVHHGKTTELTEQ